MKPTVLLASTCRWFSAARLAIAFQAAGCAVDLVAPNGHPATRTRALRATHRFRGTAPSASFHAAIRRAAPDIVLPCDDLAALCLHRLYREIERQPGSHAAVLAMLTRSLGPAANFPTIDSRSALIAVARAHGVRAPETAAIESEAALLEWIRTSGLPAVLKSDGSAGGSGVKLVRTEPEARLAMRALTAPPLAARAVKRALFDQDRTLLLPTLRRTRPTLNAQRFVPGRDATTSIAAWEGEVKALISVSVERTQSENGPASVLRVIEHAEMCSAAVTLARELNLSGLYGFDFVLEVATGHAHLIEMNARGTQTCHLPLGTGRNLPLALASMLRGEAIPESASVTDRDLIALFPQEWVSHPDSPYLAAAYHDVPWSEPALVKESIDADARQRTWYSPRRFVSLYKKLMASRDV